MRYRTLDANGDYVFGVGPGEILTNSPAAVAQAIQTRLLLMTGEWFLDQTEGTAYSTQILGAGTNQLYDLAIQQRILDTPGVKSIDSYSSYRDAQRRLSVSATVTTIYGSSNLTTTVPL